MSNVIWFHNFPNGGFANCAFELIFAKYLEKLGYQVILGNPHLSKDCKEAWELLDIPRNQAAPSAHYKAFLGEERRSGPALTIKLIENHFLQHPHSVLGVDGYFQFDSHAIAADPLYLATFEENLSLTAPPTNSFQKTLKKYHDKICSSYLITIHVRRGDYLDHVAADDWTKDVFFTLNLDNVMQKLQQYITKNRIFNFDLYIATDDEQFCNAYFNNINLNILSSKDFIDKDENNHFLVDLAAMTAANMLIISNSSLSLLGAMLNCRGRVFWRQDSQGEIISFDPWSTPILYGPVLDNSSLE